MSLAVFIAYLIGCVVLLAVLAFVGSLVGMLLFCFGRAAWDALKPLKGRT